jgi:hypothetical protein
LRSKNENTPSEAAALVGEIATSRAVALLEDLGRLRVIRVGGEPV